MLSFDVWEILSVTYVTLTENEWVIRERVKGHVRMKIHRSRCCLLFFADFCYISTTSEWKNTIHDKNLSFFIKENMTEFLIWLSKDYVMKKKSTSTHSRNNFSFRYFNLVALHNQTNVLIIFQQWGMRFFRVFFSKANVKAECGTPAAKNRFLTVIIFCEILNRKKASENLEWNGKNVKKWLTNLEMNVKFLWRKQDELNFLWSSFLHFFKFTEWSSFVVVVRHAASYDERRQT